MSESKSKSRKVSSRREDYTSSSSSTCSWSSDDEPDSPDLKAIKDYLSDRKELAHQLFTSVKREKMRMMLPQILKNIDMAELEELCASELCGMSKSRILSILNGTPMTGSSDTSETDDSGPSLEIISDTEAWMSEGDQQNYFPSSNRDKSKISKKSKPNVSHNGCAGGITKSRGKTRANNRSENSSIKIKKEKEKEAVKNQEGESLLDLLELEMRARAIKALIRKEEDIVSTLGCEQRDASNIDDLKVDIPRAFVNYTMLNESNEKLDTSVKAVSIDGDQDVVMLINPAPMINLLSSDSETDDRNRCVDKQSKHVHQMNASKNQSMKGEQKKSVERSIQSTVTTTECKKSTNNKDVSTASSSISENKDGNGSLPKNVNTNSENKELQKGNSNVPAPLILHKIIKVENQPNKRCTSMDENKLIDEEIIDLDDYPDDMDDIDNYDQISSRNEKKPMSDVTITDNKAEKSENIILSSEETWATRYYQTDSVQSVMKESKIQSEIRKRLRERQKLSKLNTCSKNTPIGCIEENNKPIEQINDQLKLTGSVQEYLALERKNNASRINTELEKEARPLDIDDNTS